MTRRRRPGLWLALCILVLNGAGWAIGELVNGVADPLDYAVQAFFVGHRETSRTVAILVPAWMEIAAAGS